MSDALRRVGISRTMHFYGDFYELPGGIRCRSTLEIVRAQRAGPDLDNLSWDQPDLVVIMANPGGSTPRAAAFEWEQREPGQIREQVDLREAVHDQTQTKVVAVMESRNYNHVRVLNLSDICQPSLERLVEELNAREGDTGDSVFASPLRESLNKSILRYHWLSVTDWMFKAWIRRRFRSWSTT